MLDIYYELNERITTLNTKTKKFETVETVFAKRHLANRLQKEVLHIKLSCNAGMEL